MFPWPRRSNSQQMPRPNLAKLARSSTVTSLRNTQLWRQQRRLVISGSLKKQTIVISVCARFSCKTYTRELVPAILQTQPLWHRWANQLKEKYLASTFWPPRKQAKDIKTIITRSLLSNNAAQRVVKTDQIQSNHLKSSKDSQASMVRNRWTIWWSMKI